MGKKSKKKSDPASGKKGGVSGLASEFDQLQVQIPSCTASCWICLDSEPDDDGRPLVRDCACRGDSGWAHLSCLVDYAESKSNEYLKKVGAQYWGTGMKPDGYPDLEVSDVAPWMKCVNCKQGIRGQLMLDMSEARLDFTKRSLPLHQNMLVVSETSFPCDPFKYVSALIVHLTQLSHAIGMIEGRASALIEELERMGEHTVAVLSEMNTAVNHSRVHMSEGQIINFEATVYRTLGWAYTQFISLLGKDGQKGERKEGAKKAIEYFEKSKEKLVETGDQTVITFAVPNIDSEISGVRQLIGIDSTAAETKRNVQQLRKMTKLFPKPAAKLQLACALNADKQVIACQRLLDEVVATTRQVHGAQHVVSTDLQETYDTCTHRRVVLAGSTDYYQLVSYKSDKIAEVRGPVTWDNFNTGTTFTVDVSEMTLVPPMPVVCQGLKGATHLNGEIGDARSYDVEKDRYVVHFENRKLKKALVKYENVRALFELPPKKVEQQSPGPAVGSQRVAQKKVAKKCSV